MAKLSRRVDRTRLPVRRWRWSVIDGTFDMAPCLGDDGAPVWRDVVDDGYSLTKPGAWFAARWRRSGVVAVGAAWLVSNALLVAAWFVVRPL